MLTPTEESGLRTILNDFSDSDLFSLADTVTKRLLNITDRNAAIQAILSCLEKPSDLLKRQKVTKKIIFSYLLKIKPFVSPESTKSDLVKMCLKEWHSIEECKNTDYENNENTSTVTNSRVSQLPQQNSFDMLKAMGTQFAMWFFPIYNTLQDFGPEHFWADCKLMGELKTARDRKEVTVVGANEVVNFLRSLIMNDKFYFDANTSQDSVTSEQDPHGLVRILVSGVVHQMSNCIGLFDCFFGLVKNPAYNDNWKIKWIHMKIHVNSINEGSLPPAIQLPSICQRA
ncbi:uncharacterized protein C3orf38 homolog [Argiope bruennichi]|uniref:Uncharacterized protein n=1 Tax=Argiope bruennichi TaxID=94029 RepID=A0A8T0E9T0_ARGBR|nr:uncharacterized protein C3orf38 homolog [Argiope bruennichi]KAF8768106.1 hypothetical protein HNY73_020959 [Argiope bruennichi]